MKKDDKILLIIISIMILMAFPQLLLLAIIGYFIYAKYNKKYNLNETISKVKDKYKNSDKTSNYEVIDTTAEVIDSKIIQEDKWTATKEYKH